ncbi:MAG TPA: nicotinate-nucleotide adenylyltransferase [Microthrixaceae bacterium]|nr:nicotinate-nucleotide adenylyltransferase [Microthrixaceae bacterium]HPB44955.1 nicotinate-nucleotide adenylyltransferase [Microthrixaceae bacterium]
MTTQRVAVFGGTFDPPHLGHLIVATEVGFRGGFDEVILMVANDPWQKSPQRSVTPAADRLDLVAAAIAEDTDRYCGLRAGHEEVRRGGATYTIDTVEAMRRARPGVEVSLVLGADAASRLESWHRVDDLRGLVELTVVGRPGAPTPVLDPRWRCTVVDVPQIEISSTEIRRRVAEGIPYAHLIPGAVVQLIRSRGLYGLGMSGTQS